MSSPSVPPSISSNETSQPPTAEELSQVLKVDVFDRDGAACSLGQLIEGKRTALIFIRHFGCLSCQAYVRCISASIPPARLQPSNQILIIGCGSYRPINTYIETTSSLYPIYTDPSRQLHSLCRFKSNLSMGVTGDEQRDYMRNAGSAMSRIWGGITYQLGNLQHLNDMGPKSLNGGELILSAGE
ncbi:hypothetical protein NX059_000958 [Plenodomus lindquistii]|nr:hypothetical protein NX059_000958 [Plenodomus lindquistii]